MNDSVLYPSGWSEKDLSEISSLITDGAHFSPVPQEYGELIVNVKDLTDNDINYEGCTQILKDDFYFLVRQSCSPKKGDILLSKDGTIGKVVLFESTTQVVLLSSIAIIRLEKEIWPDFVKHVLKSFIFDKQLYSLQSGSALKRIVLADIKQLKISLPDFKQQQKIATILSTVDNLIEKTQSLIDKYTSVKQGMMADLFTRGIDLSGSPETNKNYGQLRPSVTESPELYQKTELGWVPKDWSVVALGDISEKITSGSRDWASYYSEEGELFVRISNLTREHINFRWNSIKYVDIGSGSEGERTRLEGGDILISITADLGIIGVVPDGFERAYINQHTALVRISNNVNNPRYIGHFLQSYSGQHQFEQLGDSGAKAGLNLPTIASLKCFIPLDTEKNETANRLDAIDQLVADYKIEKEKYLNQKKGLMQDLLTGKVRVN